MKRLRLARLVCQTGPNISEIAIWKNRWSIDGQRPTKVGRQETREQVPWEGCDVSLLGHLERPRRRRNSPNRSEWKYPVEWPDADQHGQRRGTRHLVFLNRCSTWYLGELKLFDRPSHCVVLDNETKLRVGQIFTFDRIQKSMKFQFRLDVKELDDKN